MAQTQRVTDPAAQHALRALQRRSRRGLLGHIAQHRVEDRRLAQVAGDPGIRDRHHAETGILDLPHQRSHQLAHTLRVPTRLGRIRHLAHLRHVVPAGQHRPRLSAEAYLAQSSSP
jgi:hypothetical protein